MSRERRRLFREEESPVEPGRFGCPMLVRGHRHHPVEPHGIIMRCSLGWAVHDDVEVQRCQLTESVADCWKVHPERMPLVVLGSTGAPGRVETEQKASAD
jgi:hypothetical protein